MICTQRLASSQSQAIEAATDSKYTHCGIVLEVDGRLLVFEAVGPVQAVPILEWIENGINGKYMAKRIEGFEDTLTQDALNRMLSVAESNLGKGYDWAFYWSNELMYCSEFV